MTGQFSITNMTSLVLCNSCRTYSFISTMCVNQLDRTKEVILQIFRISLPFEDELISTHQLRAIPVKTFERERSTNLIILNVYDYNVILRINVSY